MACNFCEYTSYYGDEEDIMRVYLSPISIAENDARHFMYVVYEDDDDHELHAMAGIPVRYCPFCGRELEVNYVEDDEEEEDE